jgi:hypothetical protein
MDQLRHQTLFLQIKQKNKNKSISAVIFKGTDSALKEDMVLESLTTQFFWHERIS